MTYFRYPGNLRIGVRNEMVSRVGGPVVETVEPKQMLLVLLNGHQRFRLGATEFLLSTAMPEDPGPKALMLQITRENRLEYLESHGSPLVKIAISMDPDWLDHAGLREGEAAGPVGAAGVIGPISDGLSSRLWTPDAAMQEIARSVVDVHRGGADAGGQGDAGNLALMSRAIELYRSALSAVARLPDQPRAALERDPKLAELAAYVASHMGDTELGPEELARACGMGLRSLQRLCRRSLDCSPRDFIRARKLDAAFVGLSRGGMNVAQAAHVAGYASTASFSTAFKREFGMTPARAQEAEARPG